MGQFSWIDCVTGEQVINGAVRKVYLLRPAEYGGGSLEETCYDGYGIFSGRDVYDLIAEWNRDMIPEILRKIERGLWKCPVTENDKRVMRNYYEGKPLETGLERTGNYSGLGDEKRIIGIIMACYDKDNEKLDYPIKVTYISNAIYERCLPSLSDPNQGWLPDDD